MESCSGEDNDLTPRFRIRLTISNRIDQQQSTNSNSPCQNVCENASVPSSEENSERIQPIKNLQVTHNSIDRQENRSRDDRKLFKFIEPKNHQSALFVNLNQDDRDNLFISPNLEQQAPPIEPCLEDSEKSFDENMSHSCNFMTWMAATRRRASSVTPSGQTTASSTLSNSTNKCRSASSTDDLANKNTVTTPGEAISEQKCLVGSESIETICGKDSPVDNMDNMSLEEIHDQIRFWEKKVEELERKRFADDVPRTLVENIIELRKEIIDLEVQLYQQNLDSDGSVNLSPSDEILMASKFGSNIEPGQENTSQILHAIPASGSLQHRQYLSKASTGTDSSDYAQLPLLSNHKHQVRSSQQTKQIQHDEPDLLEIQDDFQQHVYQNQYRHHHSSRHHVSRHREHEIYMQIDSDIHSEPKISPLRGGNRLKSSPTRPDHFKREFRSPPAIDLQDSKSTASSSSPHS